MISLILSLILNGLLPRLDRSLNQVIIPDPEPSLFARETVSDSIPPLRLNTQNLGIKTTAKSFIIIDAKTKKTLLAKDSEKRLPIASLTKLMTALTFLDANPNWEQMITMIKTDERIGSRIRVSDGDIIKLKDVFFSALIGSANNAIMALVRSTGLGEQAFVARMNEKAKSLGLEDTNFVEPTGLDQNNLSSARDLARLLSEALENNQIREALDDEEYRFETVNDQVWHTVKNTDKLLKSYLDVIGGKTGFTDEAGYNLALETKGTRGQTIVLVILGSRSSQDRFEEAKGLATWAFENYQW